MKRLVVPAGILVGALGMGFWSQRPFQVRLAEFRTGLSERTDAQRANIAEAARMIDGAVLDPSATWSFNVQVGPRTPERGYRAAPAYLEQDLTTSIGGGLCQVSSTVYNAAALAGLGIVERHPHYRRVHSVPPGRDATVWYGKADLKLVNTGPQPVKLTASIVDEGIVVGVWGRSPLPGAIRLETAPVRLGFDGREAFRTVRIREGASGGTVTELLSEDLYRTAAR